MGSIAEIEGQLDSDLSLSAVADTAADAVACLARIGDALRFLNRATVVCRVALGRKLQLIQQRHLWDRMERAVSEQNGVRGPFHSWDDFMTHGFPEFTGLSPRIGYAALMLGKSQVLGKLPEPELRKFESLSNAFQLVKLERKGVVISQKLIAAAQTFSVEAFREMAGFGKKATVEILVDGSDTARRLQWIANVLKKTDSDSQSAFLEVLQHAMLQADGNASGALDCIIAACIRDCVMLFVGMRSPLDWK